MRNKVRRLREVLDLSQGDLARKLGVSRQTVNSIEVGRYIPSLPLALKMARFFDQNVEEIFDERSVIATVAGGGSGDGESALVAPIFLPQSVAASPNGAIYVTDNGVQGIRRIEPDGAITTVARQCQEPRTVSGGPGVSGAFPHPGGLACDQDGALFAIDGTDGSVWCLDPQDRSHRVFIEEVVGRGEALAVRSGPDAALAIADTWNGRLVLLDREWTTTEMPIGGRPTGVAFGPDGAIWVADAETASLVRFEPDGERTVAYSVDPSTPDAEQVRPRGAIALDQDSRVYFVDPRSHRVARLDGDGSVSVVAGTGQPGFSGDEDTAVRSQLNHPTGIAFDSSGSLLIADTSNHRIRRVSVDGLISTVAGNGDPGFYGDGGRATGARLHRPAAVTVQRSESTSTIVVADTGNGRIRSIDRAGLITTISSGRSRPELMPCSIAPDGNALVVADALHHRVWRLGAHGQIEVVAGTGRRGRSGDSGPAALATLDHPRAVLVDREGQVVIADTRNHQIRVVAADGSIRALAGTGRCGGDGDGGPALLAELAFPEGLATEPSGALLVADSFNHRIRRITPDGRIETLAGTGVPGSEGDGLPATEARLRGPTAVMAYCPTGPSGEVTIFIADTFNHRIRQVRPDGIITTFAGTGEADYDGDEGPAVEAQLAHPRGLALGPGSALLVADSSNDRIRSIPLPS